MPDNDKTDNEILQEDLTPQNANDRVREIYDYQDEEDPIDMNAAMADTPKPYRPSHRLHPEAAAHPKKPALWLVTFTDAMALMLTFFVLLYAMSSPDKEQWERMSSGITKGISKFWAGDRHAGGQDFIAIDKVSGQRGLDLRYLSTLITERIRDDKNLGDVLLFPASDRLVISLPSDLLFDSGQSKISPRGKDALATLSALFERISNKIEVIGHADPRPIITENGADATTNRELSLRRAAELALTMRAVGYNRPVTARGLSDAHYAELSDKFTQEERQNLSRRVDIVVLKEQAKTRGFLSIGQ